MDSLDIRTILFTMLATDILCTLVLVQLWRQSRERFSGTGFWAVDYSFQTGALFLILLRGILPDFASLVLANTMVVAGAILGYIGLERFTGRKGPQVHNYLLLFFFFLVHSYFTFIQPDLRVRTINISAALMIVCFQCSWLMFTRVGPNLRQLTRGVGFVFGAFCLVNIFRIVEQVKIVELRQDYFHSSGLENLVPLLYQLLLILLTYSLYLMVNKRLLISIENEEEKFSRAFHCAPYAIILTRFSDGKIVEVNDAFVNTTGYARPEVLGETTLGIHFWHSEDSRNKIISELSRNGSVRDLETQFRTKSGEMRTSLISAVFININNERSILSSIVDITERKRMEDERKQLITELRDALANVKTLSGLLPICSYCKRIRNDEGYWQKIEAYIRQRSEAQFSHGVCPDCYGRVKAEMNEELSKVKIDITRHA